MFEKKVLGLDIGSKYIKLALVTGGKKQEVLKTVVVATPEDSVADGEVRSVSTVAARILAALTENRIRPSELYISVNSQNIVVRDLKLPILQNNEIDPAIEFELTQSFPGLGQTHTISSSIYSAPGMPAEGIAAFCPNKILNGYVEVAKELKIPLRVIDINANTLARVSVGFATQGHENDTIVIIDIGYTMSQVNLVSGGKLLLSRQISGGMVKFDNLMANNIGILPEQAEKARQNNTYGEYGLDESAVDMLIRSAFSPVEDQIRQMIDYYKYNRGKDNAVSGILLFAGRGLDKGLINYLGETFNIPVNTLQPAVKSAVGEETGSNTAAAIGAALTVDRNIRDINLIPGIRETKAAGKQKVKMTSVLAMVIIIALMGAGATFALRYMTEAAMVEGVVVQGEIIKNAVIYETKDKLAAYQEQLINANAALKSYNASLILSTELFDDISKAMSDSIFSVNYSLTAEGIINISGISQDRPGIADFVYNLKQLEYADSVKLTSITTRAAEDGSPIDYNFLLDIKLRKAGTLDEDKS